MAKDAVGDLIAKKSYARAIDVINAELKKRRKDERLRLRLADVLQLAGRPKEAVSVLLALANDLALEGKAAKAIAVLKKIQRLEPGRSDVEEKLSYLIGGRPEFNPWSKREEPKPQPADEIALGLPATTYAVPAPAPPPPAAAPVPLPEAASASWRHEPGAAAAEPEPGEPSPLDALIGDDVEGLRDELVSLIESALVPIVPAEVPAAPGAVESPLFRDFAREELLEVMRGLRLLTFGPGAIVVTEGQPGDSLFVLTTGKCRAYVRNPTGRNLQVSELNEGDFFGEISCLTGKPRTATITAAAQSELLELDKATLDGISVKHPHVRQVLQEFYDKRSSNTVEAAIRGMGTGRS